LVLQLQILTRGEESLLILELRPRKIQIILPAPVPSGKSGPLLQGGDKIMTRHALKPLPLLATLALLGLALWDTTLMVWIAQV